MCDRQKEWKIFVDTLTWTFIASIDAVIASGSCDSRQRKKESKGYNFMNGVNGKEEIIKIPFLLKFPFSTSLEYEMCVKRTALDKFLKPCNSGTKRE